MSGDIEVDKCSCCGKVKQVSRKYYYYPVGCDCCSDTHFEIVRYCDDCTPKPPTEIRITLREMHPFAEGEN